MRSLLSILLIGVPVTLILTLVGMTQGILDDSRNRQRGVGADVVIKASESKSVVTFSAASIPAALVARGEQEPHVSLAMGVINQSIDLPLMITGIDEARFKRMTGGFTFDAGGPFQGPDDIIVDRYYANQHHLSVGQKIKLMNHDWRVAGIVEPGKLTRLAVPLATIQELNAATGKTTRATSTLWSGSCRRCCRATAFSAWPRPWRCTAWRTSRRSRNSRWWW